MGTSEIVLGFIGKSTSAIITDIRREGGERTDGKSGRYTYNISYSFTLPNGEKINGYTKKIGDSVYLKPDGTSTVRVKYLPKFPFINAMEKDTGVGIGQIILNLTGVFLIYFGTKLKK